MCQGKIYRDAPLALLSLAEATLRKKCLLQSCSCFAQFLITRQVYFENNKKKNNKLPDQTIIQLTCFGFI